jgi:hypothetical protein
MTVINTEVYVVAQKVTENMSTSDCGCVPIKLYLQKEVAGQI